MSLEFGAVNMPRALLSAALLITALPSCSAQTAAPDIANGIERDLKHKLLTLRGLYRTEKLHFAPDGKPLTAAEVSFGPSDAMFDLQRAEQKNGKLVLTGDLPAIHYNSDTGKISYTEGHILRVVEIDMPDPTWAAAMDSFWKVFFKPEEQVAAPCQPDEAEAFRAWAAQPGQAVPDQSLKPPKCLPTGERLPSRRYVTPPRAKYDPEPNYTDKAKSAHVQGTCQLSVIIDPQGRISAIMIQKPLGDGLDEEAVKAVHTWKFDPPIADGSPAAIVVKVEVSFHLYK